MTSVYFKEIRQNTASKTSDIARQLLERIVSEERIRLNEEIPLKIHMGEKGNVTFVKPENYDGIIGFLKEEGIRTCYMETSVLYGGQRFRRDVHLKTAKEHGFTQLPVTIADGEFGDEYTEVEINKKHFKKHKIAKAFAGYDQLLVLSHFKGHMLAGFGGAIKQLSMGFSSKGGKLAMHMGIKPRIINRKCKKCHKCEKRCNEHAITIDERSYIDHAKCVGCGACVAICPNKAVSIMSLKGVLHFIGIGNPFREKLVEGAYAAQKGKRNIYINFAVNITRGCDCVSRQMKPLIDDVGVFASVDPVAIDKACFDICKAKGKSFRGSEQLAYAEKIGLGTQEYELVSV